VAGKPINADLPAAEAPAQAEVQRSRGTAAAEPKPSPPPKRRRRPVPAALKAIGGLVLVALVFLLAAILGGGGANEGTSEGTSEPEPAPGPAPEPATRADGPAQTPAAEAAAELGYPTFATSNTTRVGGSDPAGIAAGVALAVFPSATPTQRPAAVTLVDEDVLMAEPLRAPLLVTAGDELPEPTSQALDALAPQGSSATRRAQVFAVGGAAAPADLRTTQIRAGSPAKLAVAIFALRDRLFGEPPAHIVLAPEAEPEFALPAAAWSARSGDPVLFTATEKLSKTTKKALKSHPEAPVFVLGPSSAISSRVVREAGNAGGKVRRVGGEDPVENALALARYASGSFGWNVNDPGHGFVVARSDAPLEAAVAAPLSASGTWGPLLLSDDAVTLPPALRDYLLDVKPGYTSDPTRAFYNHVWIIGDQEAIDVTQQAEINQLAELSKIGGEP